MSTHPAAGIRAAALLLALAGMLRAVLAAPERAPGDYLNFKRLTADDGLPAATVHCIFQDSRGFMWFGTADGLARYDGYEFRIFRHDPRNPDSLADNVVTDIEENAAGNLWLATEGGLELWLRDAERFVHSGPKTKDSADSRRLGVRQIVATGDGTLWLSTVRGGVDHFDPATGKSEHVVLHPEAGAASSENLVFSLYGDRRGQIWAGTVNGGLCRLDPSTRRVRVFPHDPKNPESLSSNAVRAITEDRQGFLWVGTSRGACRLDPQRLLFKRFPADRNSPAALQAPVVDAIVTDRDGRVWIGTDGGGISRYEPATGGFVHFRHARHDDHTLSSDVIPCIFQDRDGDFWIGHSPAGASYANLLSSPFRSYQSIPGQANSLSPGSVWAFLEDPPAGLWVGTDGGGLNKLDRTTGLWSSYRHDPRNPGSLGANSVTALCRDHLGQLWVGTWSGGLNRLDPATGTFRRYLPDGGQAGSLSNPNVWRIVEDHQRQLWIATGGGGVNRYLPGRDAFVAYRHDPADPRSLVHDNVLCLLVTRSGDLWAGTYGGLARWVPSENSWLRFESRPRQPRTLSHSVVVDLLESRNGSIWIATQGGGLNRHDSQTGEFESFRTSDGLPSDLVRGILEDDDGVLWISTNNGLTRFDPITRKFRTFDRDDGLQGRQFNRGACLRSRSGELLFGGTQGFSAFDPRQIEPNLVSAPVVLTRLEILNREIAPGTGSPLARSITETRRLEIPARESVVSFQFAALSYRSPGRNRHAFLLEGFDPSWRTAGPERRATYTNLDPGTYRLRLRAANNEGIWNEGTGLELVIVPPFWRTWWFQTSAFGLLVIALVTAGWTVSSRRLRLRLREVEHEHQLGSERQRAAEALRLSEERFRIYFENSLLAMAITTPEKGWLEVNEPLCTLLGYSKEELRGMTWAQVTHRDDLELDIGQFNRVLAGESDGYSLEKRFVRKDQTVVDTILSVRVIRRADGTPDYFLAQFQDITARKRAEEQRLHIERQMQQTQKLESLGVLAGGIAHDFNNLLVAILGNADLALGELSPMSPARESVREIEKAARRAAELCRQMLAYSGKGRFVIEDISLEPLIGEMVHLLKTTISKKAVLKLNLEKNLPPFRGDVTQIRQVLMNLVINASEALGDTSGFVTISTGAMECSREYLSETLPGETAVAGLYVWLEVSDNGCGMDEETKRRIFEPFFTTKFTGRGLGLSAALGIVRGHQGALKVTSEVNKGTTFRVLFPAKVVESAAEGKDEPAAGGWRGTGTVLLVDDEETVRSLGRRMLERLGFRVLTAADGAEALQVYRERAGDIALVLLDLTMPRLDGAETFQEMRRVNPKVRVVMSSGYTESEVAARFVGTGLAGCVQKPYSLSELRERLRAALEKQGPEAPAVH